MNPRCSSSLLSEADSRELSIFAYASGSTNRILASLVRRFGVGAQRTLRIVWDRGELDKVGLIALPLNVKDWIPH